MKYINKIILLMVISFNVIADPVGYRFSYQGELKENGSPANGLYDMRFGLFSEIVGGGNISAIKGGIELDSIDIGDVSVINGLFNVELDFGDTHFVGSDDFLDIQVRDGASTGSYTTLSPRQRINAVPYAIQSEFVENGSSPWLDITDGIGYTDDVKIGNTSTATASMLTVDADAGQSPIRFKVNGATRMILLSNGGTSFGTNTSAPDNGIRVEGIARQPLTSHGFVKAGVVIQCGAGITANSDRFFNNVNGLDFTSEGNGAGGGCSITTPFDVSDVFISVSSPWTGPFISTNVSCGPTSTPNQLVCQLNAVGGSGGSDRIQILFY